MVKFKGASALAGSFVMLTFWGQAWAADAADNAFDDAGFDEVLVTAQKRSESLKDVPLSISALGGAELQAAHVADYDDLSRAVPGLSINSGAAEGQSNIVIRGISSTSGSATVGVYLDDVSMTVKNFYDGSSQPKLFDLDRVEVLRGPQGTLWGASSEGGTIRFVTKQPDLNNFSGEFHGDLSGTVHGSANTDDGVVLNLPIIPGKVALRASAGYMFDSGYIDDYVHVGSPNVRSTDGGLNKAGVNDEQAYVARVTAKILASDSLTITPALFYQDDRTGNNSSFFPAVGLYKDDKQVTEYGRDTLFLPSLTVDKDFGFADLTSVSAYFMRQVDRQQDGTFYNSTEFAESFLDPLGGVYSANQPTNDQIIGNLRSPVKLRTNYGQLSQELRLASDPSGTAGLPLRWVVGLYYADEWDHHSNYQQIPGINQAFQNIYGFPMEQSAVETTFGAPGLTLFPNSVDQADYSYFDERQYAAFGQADYDILPDLHAAIGLRELYARTAFRFTAFGFYEIGNISPYFFEEHDSAFTPKFSLTYDVTPATNVYGSATKGFRLGAPEEPVPFGPSTVCAQDDATNGITANPTKFASDSLWTYELGSKSEFDGNRLSINGAAYLTNWKNIQQQIYLPTCGYYVTLNVGDAQITGGELEMRYKPLNGLTLGMTSSVQHAEITSTDNPLTVPLNSALIDVPMWSGTLSADYSTPLGDGLLGTARADYTMTGHSHGSYQPDNNNLSNNPNFENPYYAVLNVNFGVSTDLYELSLYAKNLLNDHTLIQRPVINTVTEGYTVRPLTVGMSGKIRF